MSTTIRKNLSFFSFIALLTNYLSLKLEGSDLEYLKSSYFNFKTSDLEKAQGNPLFKVIKEVLIEIDMESDTLQVLDIALKAFPNVSAFSSYRTGFEFQTWEQKHFDMILCIPLDKLKLNGCLLKPLRSQITLKSDFLRSFFAETVQGAKQILFECKNLERIIMTEVGMDANKKEEEEFCENIIRYLRDNPHYSSKIRQIKIHGFWTNLHEDVKRVTQSIQIPKTCFPSLRTLDLGFFSALSSLEIESESLKEMSVTSMLSLKKLFLKSESLSTFRMQMCTRLRKVEMICNNLNSAFFDSQIFLQNLKIESRNLLRLSVNCCCIESSLMTSLKSCPNIQYLQFGASYDISLPFPSKKLLLSLSQTCSKLAHISISPNTSRITKQVVNSLYNSFLKQGKFPEIESIHSVGELEEKEKKEGEILSSSLKRWKSSLLFKFFNSWRTYRDLSAVKGFLISAGVEERKDWKDLSLD